MSEIPDRAPDYHEVLTEKQVGMAVVHWLVSQGRLPAEQLSWHALQTTTDAQAGVLHAKLWKTP